MRMKKAQWSLLLFLTHFFSERLKGGGNGNVLSRKGKEGFHSKTKLPREKFS